MAQVFYKLTELAALLGVETSVLRYWEKEFGVTPLKTGPRKKLYRPLELETFREIKRLLHEERYTIVGARLRLSRPGAEAPPAPLPPLLAAAEHEAELAVLRNLLAETKEGLLALRRLLARSPEGPEKKP